MDVCDSCKEQAKKTRRGAPHDDLFAVDERRLFSGGGARGHEEQDYQCQACRAKFTWSSNRAGSLRHACRTALGVWAEIPFG